MNASRLVSVRRISNKPPTHAHERIGAGSGFPAADGPRGTSSPREQRHTRRVGTPERGRSPRQSRPARSKETDRNGLPARHFENPEAAANGRDRLSLTNVGDA